MIETLVVVMLRRSHARILILRTSGTRGACCPAAMAPSPPNAMTRDKEYRHDCRWRFTWTCTHRGRLVAIYEVLARDNFALAEESCPFQFLLKRFSFLGKCKITGSREERRGSTVITYTARPQRISLRRARQNQLKHRWLKCPTAGKKSGSLKSIAGEGGGLDPCLPGAAPLPSPAPPEGGAGQLTCTHH